MAQQALRDSQHVYADTQKALSTCLKSGFFLIMCTPRCPRTTTPGRVSLRSSHQMCSWQTIELHHVKQRNPILFHFSRGQDDEDMFFTCMRNFDNVLPAWSLRWVGSACNFAPIRLRIWRGSTSSTNFSSLLLCMAKIPMLVRFIPKKRNGFVRTCVVNYTFCDLGSLWFS